MSRLDPETADLQGLTVIEASAGTGKTYAIQKIVARLVREGVPVQRMLVTSFTNAAADELGDRIRRELESALKAAADDITARGRLERALADLDLAQVSTIHGFCQRMLREHPAEAGVHGLDGWTLETDAAAAIDRCCDEAWASLVEVDPLIDALVQTPTSVRSVTRDADRSERLRARVDAADMASVVQSLHGAALAIVKHPDFHMFGAMTEALKVVAAKPAEALQGALADVVRRDAVDAARMATRREEIAVACEELLDEQAMRDAVPRKPAAARRAALDAVLSFLDSARWLSMRAAMQAFVTASEACEQAAAEHVASDALRRLDALRRGLRVVSVDGLILRLRDAVRAPNSAMVPALRARFDVVIVDEVQDTDPAQAEILRRVFVDSGAHRVILVGDPKQSIYRFRNADLESYLALRDLCRKPVLRLDRSHRSDASMVRAVQRVFAVANPFLNAAIPMAAVDSAHPATRLLRHGEAGPGLALHLPPAAGVPDDPLQEAAWSIVRTLHEGWMVQEREGERPLRPGDLAVLCHEHWQGARVAEWLRALGVPVTVIDRSTVFASAAAHDVACVLSAVAQPGSRSSALGAMACSIMGMPAGDALDRPDGWLQRVRRCEADLRAHGVGLALRRLVDVAQQGIGRLGTLAESGGERYAVDFDHVVEELEAAERDGVRGPQALASWLARRVQQSRGGEDALVRSVGGGDSVTLMTIHGSKGLDFGVVWLPTFMTDPAADADDLAEPRRLLYVALTRAKYRTHVLWTPQPGAAASPLATLLHAGSETDPERLVDVAAARLALPDARADLEALVQGGQSRDIAFVPFHADPPSPWRPTGSIKIPEVRPAPAVPPRAVTLSFTRLAHGRDRADAVTAERDVAGQDTVRAVRRPGGAGPFDDQVERSGLRGTALGVLVHDALAEPAAFAALAHAADRTPLVQALRRHGAGMRWRKGSQIEPFADALAIALAAPTGHHAIPSVVEVATEPGRTLRELDLAAPWKASPADLADILRDERAPWSGAVADAVGRMGERELRGLLVGNLDLAAWRGGQWFIYDYKTNDLGGDPDAYRAESLHEAMAGALYPLQAAIYATMLARWALARDGGVGGLQGRIGGVAYLFVRGMQPATGPLGTWTWQPSERLIQSMNDVLPSAARAEGLIA